MYPAPDDIPVVGDDPFSEETLSNPEGYQARLRDAGPLVWLSKYGFYGVGQCESAAAVLSNWRIYSSARVVGKTDFAKEKPWWRECAVLIESDPPRHNQIRANVMKVLSPRAVTDLGSRISHSSRSSCRQGAAQ